MRLILTSVTFMKQKCQVLICECSVIVAILGSLVLTRLFSFSKENRPHDEAGSHHHPFPHHHRFLITIVSSSSPQSSYHHSHLVIPVSPSSKSPHQNLILIKISSSQKSPHHPILIVWNNFVLRHIDQLLPHPPKYVAPTAALCMSKYRKYRNSIPIAFN